jgi:hypothetical protein
MRPESQSAAVSLPEAVFADNEVPPRFGELTIRALHPRGEVDEALPIVITHRRSRTVLGVLPPASAWPGQASTAAQRRTPSTSSCRRCRAFRFPAQLSGSTNTPVPALRTAGRGS